MTTHDPTNSHSYQQAPVFDRKPDICRKLQISQRSLDKLIQQKKIPFLKVNRVVLFRWSAVEAALLKFERKAIG